MFIDSALVCVEPTAHNVLPHAISVLQAKGYNLVTLAECLGMEPYQSVTTPQTVSSLCISKKMSLTDISRGPGPAKCFEWVNHSRNLTGHARCSDIDCCYEHFRVPLFLDICCLPLPILNGIFIGIIMDSYLEICFCSFLPLCSLLPTMFLSSLPLDCFVYSSLINMVRFRLIRFHLAVLRAEVISFAVRSPLQALNTSVIQPM